VVGGGHGKSWQPPDGGVIKLGTRIILNCSELVVSAQLP